MSLSITGVPRTIRKPGTYININTLGAKTGLPVSPDKILLIGHKTSGGSATADTPIQVFSEGQAREYFGNGSPLALMVKAALEQNPAISELWCVPQDEDGSAVAASGTIAFAVSGLTAGTIYLYVGRHLVRVGVSASDTANDIAAAVNTAINANLALPFSSTVSTNTVTLTARCKGTAGNSWVWALDYTGAGLTPTITQPTSGATDADVQDALDAVINTQYDIICAEFNDSTSLDAIKAHLNTVAGPTEQRPGVSATGLTGTLSAATTLASGRNSGRMVFPYMRGTLTHPMEIGAAFSAALAGEPDKARPLNHVVLLPLLVPRTRSDLLTRTEQESCLLNGVTPLEEAPGNQVAIVRSVSSYVQDAFGSDDDTLLDIQTIRVLDAVRAGLKAKLQQDLGQVKLASTAVGPNSTDPAKIRGVILGVLMAYQDIGYLERVDDHADLLVVERDPLVPTRVNASIPADIVDGAHVFGAELNLILG